MWWQHVWQKFSITDILMAEEMQILRSFPWEFEFSSHSPYFCWSQKSQTYDFKELFLFSLFFSKCIHRDVTHSWVELGVFLGCIQVAGLTWMNAIWKVVEDISWKSLLANALVNKDADADPLPTHPLKVGGSALWKKILMESEYSIRCWGWFG